MIKRLALCFTIALVIYAAAYFGIEHRRARNGPWQVTFATQSNGVPFLAINQPALGITNIQIVFPDAPTRDSFTNAQLFDQPHAVPYDLPLGRCIFMDTTFLPGTIVFQMFGHEIQLIPRVLTLDGEEKLWHSETTFVLSTPATNPPPTPALPH